MEALAGNVFDAVRGYVARGLGGLADRLTALEKRIDTIPAGAKGAAGDAGPQGPQGASGEKGVDGRDGRDGIDGAPGRDAIDLEFRDGVDVERSYPRGTLATFDGGVIRAARTTDPLVGVDGDIVKAGWHVLWVGVKALFAERGEDGRQITLHAEYTGSERKHELAVWELPVMIYRGIFNRKGLGGSESAPGAAYAVGDVVTFDGQLWHCEAQTLDAPPGPSWRLMVRRGQDADARKGQNGQRAEPVRLK